MKKKAHFWGILLSAPRSTVRITNPVCLHCGMMWLKNDASDRAAKASCPGAEEDR